MSPAFGPLTFTASWSRLDPTGKNAFHIQSVRLIGITGSLESRISDSVRSSPPKKGCMDNNPANFRVRSYECSRLARR
ncbi:hypothetical protein M0R45_008269 [Rubus argutus]|uniref:Uncharacterized protein n=1 Tax=Rubus argutus TaxID=59490 RepID=A0AAW1Y3K6_RUBAR